MGSYILQHYQSFDAVKFSETTCSNINRELAAYKLESVIDKLPTDESCSEAVRNWCMNVKSFNYDALDTEEAMAYWTMRSKWTQVLNCSVMDTPPPASSRILAIVSVIDQGFQRFI
ncbi:hypothetical protein PS15m_011523 [Mucor circinelloides]